MQLEDANELTGQQTLATDIWQGRFDEVFELARAAGVDANRCSKFATDLFLADREIGSSLCHTGLLFGCRIFIQSWFVCLGSLGWVYR
jgi:hypothetical protein